MNLVHVSLSNCYGIKSLNHSFEFGEGRAQRKSFSIYAPNGLMKTSFTKTFDRLAQGKAPLEELFQRESLAEVLVDGAPISANAIYVLKSEIDITQESPEISNVLVNPERKVLYDSLVLGIEKQKIQAINSLQKLSGVGRKDVEEKILDDIGEADFAACVDRLLPASTNDLDIPPYKYVEIFDKNVLALINDPEFLANAREFGERYQELFTQEGTIFQKDVFNPIKADKSFDTLKSQGYFDGGHLLYLRGDTAPIGPEELDARLKALLAVIETDDRLKSIRSKIAKNAQTHAIAQLFERLPLVQLEELLEGLHPDNQNSFKQSLWRKFAANSQELILYHQLHSEAINEIRKIEEEAASLAPAWSAAVDLFNDRFTDMPFRLTVDNHVQAALGKQKAELTYVFEEGEDLAKLKRGEIKTLSQGEKRALYLLNFIFEVEAKSKLDHETLFIIDDIADSFDYKNKHAILQYLEDVDKKPKIYQVILTHNYDFFRSTTRFVHRAKCLMANKHPDKIELRRADGVDNYFVGILKPKFGECMRALCATIPFTRNIIEYTRDEEDPAYTMLTSLLHQKEDTGTITLQNYVDVYNNTFNKNHFGSDRVLRDIIYEEADEIADKQVHTGINLEDKVVLSVAIRLKAEMYILQSLRIAMNNPGYWCDKKSQFGALLGLYEKHFSDSGHLPTLRKVSVTVSSNIHLNSFMYEPILDLSIGSLAALYKDVSSLRVA